MKRKVNSATSRRKKEWEAYQQILQIALPIMVQNLFSAAISSADVIMLNSVGQSAISAVSLAVQYSNVIFMVYYGLGAGASMLCAQYWGKGDLRSIEKVQGIALRFTIAIAALCAGAAAFVPELMMKVFTNDPELIQIGSSYLRIISVSYLCWGISEIYMSVLRSVERVKISMVLNVSALLINICLNAVFIYGLFGMPKLGAAGVALATTISRLIQLIACIAVSVHSKDVKLKVSALFGKSGLLMKDYVRLSLPALGSDLMWSTGISAYTAIMGHISSDLVAANSIVTVVRNFGTVLCYGVASACMIIVGKELGANDFEKAEADTRRSMVLTVAAGIGGGLVVALIRPFVLHFAALSPTAMRYLSIMLLINTYYILGTAINSTCISGLFRAGGDSRFGFICDAVGMWAYAVPVGCIAAFVLKLPPMWVYFLVCTDAFFKWPLVIRHYRSRKWMRNITRES